MNLKNKTLKYLIISVIGISALYFLILFLNENNHKFSKRKWDQNPGIHYQIAEDLVKKKILINKSETEVIQLLGEPTNRYDSLNFWRYNVGVESVMMMDVLYHLNIFWGKQRVDSARVDTILVKL